MTIHLIDEADLRLKRPEPERGIETAGAGAGK